jgi:ABC-type phosphate transport system substrate-binding protein
VKKLSEVFACATVAAALLVPHANAATALVIGAGSSALWQAAAVGAFNDLAGTGAGHYTIKGACSAGNCAQLDDTRSSSIALQSGSLWIVWSSDHTKVWAYISVDSTVGDRVFFAAPRAQLQVSADVKTKAGANLISSALFKGKVADAASVPADVYTAINNAKVTTAFTDIRPEDAKFATTRADDTLGSATGSVLPGLGLGYGTGPSTLVGTSIKSQYSTAFAQPVNFSLSGATDPFSKTKVPASVTIPVGADPVIVIINRTSSTGFGKSGFPTNLTHTQLGTTFGVCPVLDGVGGTTVQREPLSGTMNTFEYTELQAFSQGASHSQEAGVNPTASGGNPLNLSCTSSGLTGHRTRAIGTGELVSEVKAVTNSIGYAFFSYGNVSSIAASDSWHYLQVDSVDPINSTYSTGRLPTCTAPCPAASGASFPNLRNGTYKSWSLLRAVTDASGANNTNTKALVAALQNNVNSTVPDFVPFVTTNGSDPGLKKYRSHFTQSGVAPNNGLSSQTEAGGDVGGCIETTGPAPGVLNCHQ